MRMKNTNVNLQQFVAAVAGATVVVTRQDSGTHKVEVKVSDSWSCTHSSSARVALNDASVAFLSIGRALAELAESMESS